MWTGLSVEFSGIWLTWISRFFQKCYRKWWRYLWNIITASNIHIRLLEKNPVSYILRPRDNVIGPSPLFDVYVCVHSCIRISYNFVSVAWKRVFFSPLWLCRWLSAKLVHHRCGLFNRSVSFLNWIIWVASMGMFSFCVFAYMSNSR